MSVLSILTRRPVGPFFKGNVDTLGYVDKNTKRNRQQLKGANKCQQLTN